MRLSKLFVTTCSALTIFIPFSGYAQSLLVTADKIEWKAQSEIINGTKFVTDGSFLLDSQYVLGQSVPAKVIPAKNVQLFFDSKPDREFGLNDLRQKEGAGHYVGPGPVQINKKYIDHLRKTSLGKSIRFKAKGPLDPILIYDGNNAVGVVMPMKM